MKYKSTLFDEARNKIGSVVASANKDGNYFRAKVTPRNPRTQAQQMVRSLFTINSQAWRELTDEQRAGWTALAKQVTLHDSLGNKYAPSGQQLYVSCKSNGATVGLIVPDDAPAVPDGAIDITGLAVVATVEAAAPNTQTLTLSYESDASLGIFAYGTTAQFSAGRSFVGPSQYRFTGDQLGPKPTPISILAKYQALHGNLVVGSKLALSIKGITPHGFASLPQVMIVTVAAA